MQRVGADFCPLEGLVQGGRYGRRPPGRSPGRAPLRDAPPLLRSGGPAAGLLRPAQAVKRESDPCAPAMLPALSLPGRRGLCCGGGGGAFALWESWCRGIDTAAGRPGEARAGRPGGAPPAAEQRGPAAGLLRPAQTVKRESIPATPPRKSTCPNRIAPPPGAFLHHGGMGGIGWCSGRPSRRPIDT